ncbi:MAG: ribonuclease E inhibitor RraB [Pseudomonadales bacterium]
MPSSNEKSRGVLRDLQTHGFDFSRECEIEFNIAFEHWPPSEESLSNLRNNFALVRIQEPSQRDRVGYATLIVKSLVTYDFLLATEEKIRKLVKECDESCQSWGVRHRVEK